MLAFMAGLTTLWAQGNERKCAAPMDDFYFRRAMAGFAHQYEGPNRDREIRTFTAANCLNTAQTRRLAALYSNEFRRFDYVTYAADFVIDYNNYSSMADLFHNPALQHDFLDYIGYNSGPALPTIPGYTGRLGGPNFASDIEFDNIYEIMRINNFDGSKLDAFNAASRGRLFTAAQLSELSKLFSFDSNRFNFAKSALAACYDLDNFYMLGAAFSYEHYRRDLNAYYMDNVNQYVWAAVPTPQHGWNGNHHNNPLPVYCPVPGYTGRIGHQQPMSDVEFRTILAHANDANFDHSRLDLIKAAAGSRGFTAAQAQSLANTFDFDSNRYQFATWAFDKTYDIDNFYILAATFDFNSYKRDLLQHIV